MNIVHPEAVEALADTSLRPIVSWQTSAGMFIVLTYSPTVQFVKHFDSAEHFEEALALLLGSSPPKSI